MTPSMVNLIEDDMVVTLELSMLTSNIIKQVHCDVLNGFVSFLRKIYEKKKIYDMLYL